MASINDYLAAAWTYCAPNRDKSQRFPRGFWPDVARVAVAMLEQDTDEPNLDFTPTKCVRGCAPEPMRTERKKSGGKISAADKAANTAALLAMLHPQANTKTVADNP